jgi:hypothetical protein
MINKKEIKKIQENRVALDYNSNMKLNDRSHKPNNSNVF